MPAVVSVHVLPSLVSPGSLAGSQCVVVDLLRASTTICAMLRAGAPAVRPVLEASDAIALKTQLSPQECLLGGERAAVLIPGFDLGNSPSEYTALAVRSREVIFTTTNGTRAILAAKAAGAASIVIGALANLSSLVEHLRRDGRPVHILCAGTNGQIAMEDVLCAGAITDRLLFSGDTRLAHARDDQSRIALKLWAAGDRRPRYVLDILSESLGGRNLIEIGLQPDIFDCARLDWLPVVPLFDPATQQIKPAA